MPINFSSLPYHIQVLTTEKMKFEDLAAFEESSEHAMNMANRNKAEVQILPLEWTTEVYFCWKNNEIHYSFKEWKNKMEIRAPDFSYGKLRLQKLTELSGIRFHAKRITIHAPLHEQYCLKLTEYFKNSGSTGEDVFIHDTSINYHNKIACLQSQFNQFLETAEVNYVDFYGHMLKDWFFEMSESITSIRGVVQLDDEDLFQIKILDFFVGDTEITNKGLNRLLKEWINGKKEINDFGIHKRNFYSISDVFDGIVALNGHHISCNEGESFECFIENVNGQRLWIKMSNICIGRRDGIFSALLEGFKRIMH